MASNETEILPRVFVLPKMACTNASILTLAHPRSLLPTRYVFSPECGVLEFTRIAAPKTSHRSWLLNVKEKNLAIVEELHPRQVSTTAKDTCAIHDDDAQDIQSQDCVAKTAEMFAATHLDPLFLVLPVLSPSPSTHSTPSKPLFLTCEDHFDKLTSLSQHFHHILDHGPTKEGLGKRLQSVCDMVDGGDEMMYRLSEEKLLQQLCLKAKKMTLSGLPASMEEKFVRKPLEVPVISLKYQTSMVTKPSFEIALNHDEVLADALGSQSSIATPMTVSTNASQSTSISTPPELEATDIPPTAPPEVVFLLRLRVALTYLLTAYVPPSLATKLIDVLAGPTSPINFGPCDAYLARMAALRAEALASRSLADFSGKRGMNEDERGSESRAEKKQRREDDEQRTKAGQSRAVRELKKVDVTGMKKMSDFFGKDSSIGKEKER